jgi:hypothetical protein
MELYHHTTTANTGLVPNSKEHMNEFIALQEDAISLGRRRYRGCGH